MEEQVNNMTGIGKRAKIIRWIIVAAVLAVGVSAALWATILRGGSEAVEYQVATISRGDLENTVTCTGALSAVGTVEIGTQVSGTVDQVFVDFNDHVSKDQVLAVLDTTTLSAVVTDASAGLLNAQAQYDQALAVFQRDQPLAEKGYVSEQEFLPIKTEVKTREASLRSATASLDRAKANLANAVIRSPIEGTVIQRAVEPGQTVAASFSTPKLFIIASDLARMEILVSVDESDIAQVKTGQTARFTVQGYPDQTFEGVVKQIRLQPEKVSNVVTYTVVVAANNDRGLLLPGMTATVDLVVERTTGALLVPNAALRVTPTEEMMADAKRQMREQAGALPDSTGAGSGSGLGRGSRGASFAAPAGAAPGAGSQGAQHGAGPGGAPGAAGAWSQSGDRKVLWILDQNGKVEMRPVKTGASDGKMTEIASARGVEEGMTVITGFDGQGTASGTGQRSSSQGGPHGFRLF